MMTDGKPASSDDGAKPITVDPCTRCNGWGSVQSTRSHFSIPGLCFDCDGDGRGETQRRNRKKIAEDLKALQVRDQNRQHSESAVRTIRERHGTGRPLIKARKDLFLTSPILTTAQYAEHAGIPAAAAFQELATAYPAIQVAFDAAGQAVGWRKEY